MESRNMVLMNLFAGQQWRRRHREKTVGGRERMGQTGGVAWKHYVTMCKIDSLWEFSVVTQGTQSSAL